MTTDQITKLESLNWTEARDSVTGKPIAGHRIAGKLCQWFDGTINGADRSAWIAEDGSVFLHGGPDMTFHEFIDLLTKPAVSTRARGLFDLTEDS